jgi:hypothetical protein
LDVLAEPAPAAPAPVGLAGRLTPVGRILNEAAEGWTVWDCSPILDAAGRVHVFFTRWRAADRPDAQWYNGTAQIVHAVADRTEGPYEIRGIVLQAEPGAGRWDAGGVINTKIYRVGDRYALLYTGCREGLHDTQAVGLLLAPSLDGPWTRASDGPIIAPAPDRTGFDGYLCNNPAMVARPDGQIRVYYKGRPVAAEKDGRRTAGKMRIGLATAGNLAGPYRKHPGGWVFELDRHIEDPCVWHDGTAFRMLLSELGYRNPAGIIVSSSDGVRWSGPEPGYPSPETFTGRKQRLEEPNLLFRDGLPTHLFTMMGACPEDNAYSGFVFQIRGE